VRVLNLQVHDGFPFAVSTRLYPEWAFARLPHTNSELVRKVMLALLQMTPASAAARATDAAGWTRPQDYGPVHELLRELGLGPYAGLGGWRAWQLARQHWQVSVAVGVALLALSLLVVHYLRLVRRLRASERKLLEIRHELESSNAVLQQRSTTDGLTRLSNRRVFDETLEREWTRAMRNGAPLAVILTDIDLFKRHNDTYGHQAGDECLRQVAATLAHTVKRSGDLIARYGGEEFAIILPSTDIKGAAAAAERMRAAVERIKLAHINSPTRADVTISLGVAAVVPTRAFSAHALIEAADQALYQAKAVGRNQVILADLNAAAA
jgi:diguanylate cyclase (GGDEF)-like protein